MAKRTTAKRTKIVVPGPEHICSVCGCNTESWRYAFATEYRRLRLAYLGPDGYLQTHDELSVWRMYKAALDELRCRLLPLLVGGVFGRHECRA
jgi:hypothetical protein